MYTLEELNVHLLSELKEIAEKLDITDFKKLPKKELIYKILDKQAITPEKDLPAKTKPAEEKMIPNGKNDPTLKTTKTKSLRKKKTSQRMNCLNHLIWSLKA